MERQVSGLFKLMLKKFALRILHAGCILRTKQHNYLNEHLAKGFGYLDDVLYKCVRCMNQPLLGLLHGSLARPFISLPSALATSNSLDVKHKS